MYKQTQHHYKHLFERQVENFIQHYFTLPLAKVNFTIALGISAGSDSVALLHYCTHLRTKYPNLKFVVLHFNHQSRPLENEQEQKFVVKLCQKYHFPYYIKNYEATDHSELAWREARKIFFAESMAKINDNCQIWLAHHLDDSWEWSQMQQAKSGNISGCLGIPVRHGKIFRPFLSVSKKQILNYLKQQTQMFLEDSTNSNTAYERNWWRIHILKSMKKKYPNVLKHYVQRSMELALELNLVLGQTGSAKNYVYDNETHLFYFESKNKIQHSIHLIKKSLHQLSKLHRMKIDKQLKSLIQCYENRKKGPISFSGSVKAFVGKNYVILTSKNNFIISNDILNVILRLQIQEEHNKNLKYSPCDNYRR